MDDRKNIARVPLNTAIKTTATASNEKILFSLGVNRRIAENLSSIDATVDSGNDNCLLRIGKTAGEKQAFLESVGVASKVAEKIATVAASNASDTCGIYIRSDSSLGLGTVRVPSSSPVADDGNTGNGNGNCVIRIGKTFNEQVSILRAMGIDSKLLNKK